MQLTLNITGAKVDFANTQYDLGAGWTIISYIKDSEMPIIDAFKTLTDDGSLVIVKNNKGDTYIPEYGIDNIINLIPGQSYYIYLNQAKTFVFPN